MNRIFSSGAYLPRRLVSRCIGTGERNNKSRISMLPPIPEYQNSMETPEHIKRQFGAMILPLDQCHPSSSSSRSGVKLSQKKGYNFSRNTGIREQPSNSRTNEENNIYPTLPPLPPLFCSPHQLEIYLSNPQVIDTLLPSSNIIPLIIPEEDPIIPLEENISNNPLECKHPQWQKRHRKKTGVQSTKWMRRAARKGRL